MVRESASTEAGGWVLARRRASRPREAGVGLFFFFFLVAMSSCEAVAALPAKSGKAAIETCLPSARHSTAERLTAKRFTASASEPPQRSAQQRAQASALHAKQITQLNKEVIRRPNQRLILETLQRIRRCSRLTSVTQKHHRPRVWLIREQRIAAESSRPLRDGLLSTDDQREKRARLVTEIVVLRQRVFAHEPEKNRARELILRAHPRDRVASDHAAVRPPPIVLI